MLYLHYKILKMRKELTDFSLLIEIEFDFGEDIHKSFKSWLIGFWRRLFT